MAKTKISEFSATPGNNTDIDGINIAEGCAPSGINDAIRELMSQLKDWQSGASNDPMTIGSSGSLTLSYGTANGVVYLNGSKVLTTGSALTFDGTTVSSPVVQSTNGTITTVLSYSGGNSTGVVGTTSNHSLEFRQNNTEQMRLTSTGLGIGTSSVSEKLTVGGSIAIAGGRGTSYAFKTPDWRFYNTATGNAFVWDNYTTEFMRLDSSGNLGLGVTPSAWSNGKAIESNQVGSAFWGNTDLTALTAGYYYNSGDKYAISSKYAMQFQMNYSAGEYRWYNTTTTGSAGTNASVVQAMTLDKNGNLGVGSTSPSQSWTGGSARVAQLQGGSSQITVLRVNESSGTYGDLQLVSGASAEVGIYNFANGAMRFGTNSSERARITSGGTFLVGTTTAEGVGQTLYASGLYVNKYSGTSGTHIQFLNNNGVIGSISSSGTATAYNTSSDYRLKENIAPMIGALAKVLALKPVTYKWKVDGSNGEGFIAHELQAVVPQCVTGEKDAVDAEGKPVYQGIDTSFLVATLTAALQEAVAEINQLKARLDAANL